MSGRIIHRTLFVVWILLAIPTLTIWRDSLAWIGFMSVYAIIASHSVGWEAGRAEEAAESTDE